jgi:hypothetical protein
MSVQVIRFSLSRLSVEVSVRPRRTKSKGNPSHSTDDRSSGDRLYQRFPSVAREFDSDMKLRI